MPYLCVNACCPAFRCCEQASEDLCVKLWDTRTPGVLKLADKLAGYVYFPVCGALIL